MPSKNLYARLAGLDMNDESSTPVVESRSDPATNNDESDSDGNASDKQEIDDDDDDSAYIFPVDLIAQESAQSRAPIFTRALLMEIKQWKDTLDEEFKKEPSIRGVQSIELPAKDGTLYKIWDWENNTSADAALIEYMSRVELSPEFQRQFGTESYQIKHLRRYNDCDDKTYFDMPYSFEAYQKEPTIQPSFEYVKEFKAALNQTKSLWAGCSSRAHLRTLIQQTAPTCPPIKKIVCLGLGTLHLDQEHSRYANIMQYMALFTIAKTLDEHNLTLDPSAVPIQISLQDPCHDVVKDSGLLSRFSERTLTFVSDPDALLAIDARTLVLTAYLPVQMPLLQILADLFAAAPETGPAAIIGDAVLIEPERREYNWGDRGSPAVARWLGASYEEKGNGFTEHEMEPAFISDVFGEERMKKGKTRYWIRDMGFYVRKL